MSNLPDWAVAAIVNKFRGGLSSDDTEQIVRSVMDSASFAFESIRQRGLESMSEYDRPHAVMRPALSVDGNKWCALYGENPQDGVAGFGDSPALAMEDFDRAWTERLRTAPPDTKADAEKGD